MCGICGLATPNPAQSVDRAVIERMTNIVCNRGPDSQGFHLAPGIGLGVRRLAINDLETGDQPISNEDGSVTVVCNGEIYNFLELRQELQAAGHAFGTKSDVEVIVHLYEDDGPECVQRLRGMFAFALWDARRQRLMLARDRLGIKPLHYSLGNDGCCFGSECKSILVAGQVDRRIEARAVEDLFTFGFVTGPKTLHAGIRRLMPGHYLLYRDGSAAIHCYWDVSFPPRDDEDTATGADVWAQLLLEKLREVVRLHLRSDVPVGAWLSPGIDSSSIVALANGLTAQPMKTFTLTFESHEVDEAKRHRTLDSFPSYALAGHSVQAKNTDLALYRKAVWHCENVSAYGNEVSHLLLAESSAKQVKVVLLGQGSDEIFGGYPWFVFEPLLRPLAGLPLGLRRAMSLWPLLPGWWPWARQMLLAPREMNRERYRRMVGAIHPKAGLDLLSPQLEDMLTETADSDDQLSQPPDFDTWHPFAQLQYYELKVRLPDFICHHVDRMSMAHSVEARVPFLDHELVELCASIPVSLKLKGWQEKHILRRAMRGILPAEFLARRKRGFRAPSGQWLREKLPEFALVLLSEDALRQKGYFKPDAVLQLLERHRTGGRSYAHQLLVVLAIQLWDDLFLRGCALHDGAVAGV